MISCYFKSRTYMGVSKINGTPKSSILIGFSIINHPFWGIPIFGNTHILKILFFTPSRVALQTLFFRRSFQAFRKQFLGASSRRSTDHVYVSPENFST